MNKYAESIIQSEQGSIEICVRCRLDSLADVNELIDMLVRAKNQAFPSGAEEHRVKMEAFKKVCFCEDKATCPHESPIFKEGKLLNPMKAGARYTDEMGNEE